MSILSGTPKQCPAIGALCWVVDQWYVQCRHHRQVELYWEGHTPSTDLHEGPCYEGRSFAVVDFELTATASEQGRIIEIGVILLDEQGQEEGQWRRLINPEIPFGDNVHGLFPKDVENAPTFSEVSIELYSILQSRVLVAHQVEVERDLLVDNFFNQGLRYDPPSICTSRNSGLLSPPDHSLGGVCASIGISNKHPHSALYDAKATASLFQHLWLRARVDGAPLLLLSGPCSIKN